MRIKGLLFIILCLILQGQGIASDSLAPVSLSSSPRQYYLNQKEVLFGLYNDLKFTVIEIRDWLGQDILEKGQKAIPLQQGVLEFHQDLNKTISGMVQLGQEWGKHIKHFGEQDAVMLAYMEGHLEKTVRYKTDLAQIAQLLNSSFAQEEALELATRNIELKTALKSILDTRNSLLPNISSLFSGELVSPHRSFNNIVLSQVKVTASGLPDRNFILLAVIEENISLLPPQSRLPLHEIAILYSDRRVKKAERRLRKLIRHLRKEHSTINADVMIYYILRLRFLFQVADENFEILKARDLYDRIKSKREYMNNLQKLSEKCLANQAACTDEERQNLEAEFKNHRASLVELYSRFQAQYLKMFEMYESLDNLMPEYLRIHTTIKHQIENGLFNLF